jgi:hypothetical protein
LIAAARSTIWIAWVVWSVSAVVSTWRSQHLNVQRVASFTLLRLCPVYLPVSLIGQVHIVKASFILIAQSPCLIQTFAGGSFAIILEAYEPVGRRALITTFSYVYADPIYARRTAATSSCINWRILSYDCAILELLPLKSMHTELYFWRVKTYSSPWYEPMACRLDRQHSSRRKAVEDCSGCNGELHVWFVNVEEDSSRKYILWGIVFWVIYGTLALYCSL